MTGEPSAEHVRLDDSRLRQTLAGLVPLQAKFYARDPVAVSRELLGKVLIRDEGRRLRAGRIVEVEAYLGLNDPASHAAPGKTLRNAVLFGPPGHAYIYFIYGNHYCLNVSCEPDGQAGGVLFRALEPMAGTVQMASARHMETPSRPAQLRLLASGPGRLAQAFDITRPRDNDKELTSAASDLRVVDDGFQPEKILATPRIGITKAADELLRFVIAGNVYVSGKRA